VNVKKLPVILFFGGLLIQLAALFGEHATEIPFVLRLIAPSYYHANQGIEKIVLGNNLKIGDEGFNEISAILLKTFKEKNNVSPAITDLRIDKIWFTSEASQANEPIEAFALINFNIETTTTVIY
jgi:hypothetical protein